MAIVSETPAIITVALKAIPTLPNVTDSIQIGGSTDGAFHGADADATIIKPFRFYDLGSGHFLPGVSLRSAAGAEIGTAASPLKVDVLSSAGPTGVALEVTLAAIKNLTPKHGFIWDGNSLVPIQHVVITTTSASAVAMIAAELAKKIRVLGYSLNADAVVTAQFIDESSAVCSNKFYAVLEKCEQAAEKNFLFDVAENKRLDLAFAVPSINFSIRIDYAMVAA